MLERLVRIKIDSMLVIVADSREQLPYEFICANDVTVSRGTLNVGDYALKNVPSFAVERKSLNDLIGSLFNDRERFRREFERAKEHGIKLHVVVECTFEQLRGGRYRSNVNPVSVLASIASFTLDYGCNFFFCNDRGGAEYMTYILLKQARDKDVKRCANTDNPAGTCAACDAN